jgi:hypothetical protein
MSTVTKNSTKSKYVNKKAIFMKPGESIIETTYRVQRGVKLVDVIPSLMPTGTSMISCNLGTFIKLENSDYETKRNDLVCSILKSESLLPDEITQQNFGSFILIADETNEHNNNTVATLTVDALKKVRACYNRIGRLNSKSKKRRVKNGPKKAKTAWTMYQAAMMKSMLKTEKPDGTIYKFGDVSKFISSSWKKMTDEAKQEYIDQAAPDRERYRLEKLEWDSKNKEPPKRVRSAYQMFISSNPKNKGWKSMSESDKQQYVDESKQDAQRYNDELVEYKTWCGEQGKDFDALVSLKNVKTV